MIYDKYNKFFAINDLYVGKPFVYDNNGIIKYRRIAHPFIRWGRLMSYNVEKDQYNIGWNGFWLNDNYTHVRYTLHELLHVAPLHYGYGVGQKVVRVTDGGIFTIKKINFQPNNFYVMTEEDEGATLSFGLFIPQPHETFDINPFLHQEQFPNNLFNIS